MSSLPVHAGWTRWLAIAIACATAALLVLLGIPVLFGSPLPLVRVYWRAIGEADRLALEQQFRLSEPTGVGDGVWSYVPLDTSADTLGAIVAHPSVADTDGINRREFRIADRPPLTPRRGGLLDGAFPWMARGARLLAYLLASLSGLFFLRAGAASPAGAAMRRRARTLPGRALGGLRGLASAARARVAGGATRTDVAVASVGAFLATLAWRFLTFTGFTNDHYAHLALAQQMLLGDTPIRDFSDPGWPLAYLLTAAGWLVAGDAVGTEWTITALGFALGAAFTVTVAHRLSGSLAIALLVTLFEVLIFPRSYSHPKMLLYGLGAWVIVRLATSPTRRRSVAAAAVIAVAFLFRHDHGLFIGVASAVCVALASRTDGWRVALRRVATLTGVTATLILPWMLFVQVNGGLIEYFRAGLEFSALEVGATRLTAWPQPTLGPLDVANASAWLTWLFWSLPAVCAVLVWRRARRPERWPGEISAIWSIIVVAALVNASFIRQALEVRLPDAIVPVALLGAWALGVCWTAQWRDRGRQRLVQSAALVCVVACGAAVSRVGGLADQWDNASFGAGTRGVLERSAEVIHMLRSSHRTDAPSRHATALLPFYAYLDRCTSRSDRLAVTGDAPDIPVLARRRFAGDGVVFAAGYSSSLRQTRTLARLRADPALFTIHVGDYTTFQDRFSLIDGYIAQAYEPLTEVPVVEGDTIRILVLRDRPRTGVDAQTGWPCFDTALRPGSLP